MPGPGFRVPSGSVPSGCPAFIRGRPKMDSSVPRIGFAGPCYSISGRGSLGSFRCSLVPLWAVGANKESVEAVLTGQQFCPVIPVLRVWQGGLAHL